MRHSFSRRTAAAVLMCASVSFFGAATTTAPAEAVEPTTPEPAGWILVDAGTGNVLASRDAHTPRPPASMVKIVTALTALDRLSVNSKISITAKAVQHGSQNRFPNGMQAGQTWSMKTALGVLLVSSGNDAAFAIAENVTPDVDDFGAAATDTARRIGMTESTFNDPSGLDDEQSIGGGPLMSPYDVAIAVRNARSVPQIQSWLATTSYTYTDPQGVSHTLKNSNSLLTGLSRSYPGADGAKTGFTTKAGGTLAATATRDGRTIIAVVMSSADTFGWAQKLLDQGFATQLGAVGDGNEKLPAVAYTSFSQRKALQRDFAALATQSTASTSSGLGAATTVATNSAVSTSAPATTSDPSRTTQERNGNVATNSDSSVSTLTFILIAAAFVGAIIARRAQVKRQKARRLAKRRSMQAALRRGSLPVVDGKYRAGMRTGPPVASNVRVTRGRDAD